MVDVQNSKDDRNIAIDQVGVTDLRFPIRVLDREHRHQDTIANLTMSVNLPHHFKGTHMSRFVEVLTRHRGEVTMNTLPALLRDLKGKLEAESARVELRFPYFLERPAPVTGASAPMDYECWFLGEANGGSDDFVLGVKVPVTSVCPCSKELAATDYDDLHQVIKGTGAHNQRGLITVEVRGTRSASGVPALIWIEELVKYAEDAGSCPVYPLLKREDEKHVTIAAYNKPQFVEDIVRDVALTLKNDTRVAWFKVEAVNQESIHNHSAFARITWQRS